MTNEKFSVPLTKVAAGPSQGSKIGLTLSTKNL